MKFHAMGWYGETRETYTKIGDEIIIGRTYGDDSLEEVQLHKKLIFHFDLLGNHMSTTHVGVLESSIENIISDLNEDQGIDLIKQVTNNAKKVAKILDLSLEKTFDTNKDWSWGALDEKENPYIVFFFKDEELVLINEKERLILRFAGVLSYEIIDCFTQEELKVLAEKLLKKAPKKRLKWIFH